MNAMICARCAESLAKRYYHRTSQMGKERIECCRCYVEGGAPPADWHPECMETYNKNLPTQAPGK